MLSSSAGFAAELRSPDTGIIKPGPTLYPATHHNSCIAAQGQRLCAFMDIATSNIAHQHHARDASQHCGLCLDARKRIDGARVLHHKGLALHVPAHPLACRHHALQRRVSHSPLLCYVRVWSSTHCRFTTSSKSLSIRDSVRVSGILRAAAHNMSSSEWRFRRFSRAIMISPISFQ